ncbi:MAG: hypothetical protein QMB64_05995 [Pseudomonadales bacterium]
MTDLSTLTTMATLATTSAAICYLIAIVQLLMATRSNARLQQTQAFPVWGLAGAVLHLLTIAINTIEHQGAINNRFYYHEHGLNSANSLHPQSHANSGVYYRYYLFDFSE